MDRTPSRSELSSARRRALRLCLPFVVFGLPTVSARAETRVPVDGASTLTRHAWTTDEGLPDNSVLSIAQTQDGYLWVGTRGGLARFDGVRFAIFDQRNQPTWSSDVINALCAARDG